jgi:hypothetical protein
MPMTATQTRKGNATMSDDATIRRQVIAILKDMIEAVEATLDAELEPKQPAPRAFSFEELAAAFPYDPRGWRHFDSGRGSVREGLPDWHTTACGIEQKREWMTDDPRQVGCGRCRLTHAWRDAASALLSAPAPSSTPLATATASSPSTSTH